MVALPAVMEQVGQQNNASYQVTLIIDPFFEGLTGKQFLLRYEGFENFLNDLATEAIPAHIRTSVGESYLPHYPPYVAPRPVINRPDFKAYFSFDTTAPIGTGQLMQVVDKAAAHLKIGYVAMKVLKPEVIDEFLRGDISFKWKENFHKE